MIAELGKFQPWHLSSRRAANQKKTMIKQFFSSGEETKEGCSKSKPNITQSPITQQSFYPYPMKNKFTLKVDSLEINLTNFSNLNGDK